MNKQTVITNSAEETKALGASVVKNLKGVNVIALHGELGSGKTTFVQGIAEGLEIKNRIISPTFIIIRSYKVRIKNQESRIKNFFHIDIYRLESEKEIDNLGLSEVIEDPNNLVVIEWAERMGKLLPEKRVDISFEYLDEKKRKITIK